MNQNEQKQVFLLVDFSQVAYRSTAAMMEKYNSLTVEQVRQCIVHGLNQVRDTFPYVYKTILCLDSETSWRKKVMPQYKANRKTNRDKSDFDWKTYYQNLNTVIEELSEVHPAVFVKADEAEGDDIIAKLSHKFLVDGAEVVIYSSDKDFNQIRTPNCKQYCPNKKAFMEREEGNMNEHILKGDYVDGIPNILSDDDTYTNPEKKTVRFKKADIEHWLSMPYYKLLEEIADNNEHPHYRNFMRNYTLIDLHMIPWDIKLRILEAYDKALHVKKGNYRKYLIEHSLLEL